jgi:ATPase subunit of ABC transporter with duplicated ATPase domains
MPRIVVAGVVFEHAARGPFPLPFDLELEPGWTGVVGPNGAGKTTLLRLLAGELTAARGAIRIEPPTSAAIMLEQTVEWTPALARTLERFAEDWSAHAGRLRSRLGLEPEQLDRWTTLSPGERKGWQLGAALAAQSAVLLCDEPSNHLDARARALLIDALRSFAGVGVIVSHDRELLDALCHATCFVDFGGRVELRPGSYGPAADQREAERARLAADFELARAHERRLAKQVEAARRRQASTQRSRRVSTRKQDHRDHDASSMARKYRAETAAASAAAGVRRAQSAHARELAKLERLELDHRHGGELFVDWEPPRKAVLVSLTPAELPEFAPHPGTRLPGDRPVVIGRHDRIHVGGPNGAGKTSVLQAVLARARASLDPGRVLWMAQELDAAARAALLAELRGLDRLARGRVLQIVAAAGVDPDVLLATCVPSPGEARKLGLALGLARSVWLAILDEPTNHLDLPGREAVEAMLRSYPGALLISSHDPRFAAAVTDQRWDLDRSPAHG